MGQLLTGPVTDKHSGDGYRGDARLAYGYSAMQGWRERMEDAHIAIPSLGLAVGSGSARGWRDTSVFGVFDGHGGEQVAHFVARHLPAAIAQGPAEDPTAALVAGFHRMDELLFDPSNREELQSLSTSMVSPIFGSGRTVNPDFVGCTAVVCCVRPDSLTVANAGDSRAVFSRRGRAMEMSEDHKPNLPGELRRIHRAGGCVVEQHAGGQTHYRVNGNLNLSRSIGDLTYKQNFHLMPKDQVICCTPDVRTFWRQPGDEFVVLACDGVWDVLSSQEVVDYIRPRLGDFADLEWRIRSGHLRLSGIIEDLLDHCLSPDLTRTFGLGGDNMTLLLVVFTGEVGYTSKWLEGPSAAVEGNGWMCPYK
mmetsp:Transcript_48298/g.103456  ORF Transcript_48298/g.103456 Transcript_48298/m.103456 type:complete len:364 (+) Transcript_48298:105-1196(+)